MSFIGMVGNAAVWLETSSWLGLARPSTPSVPSVERKIMDPRAKPGDDGRSGGEGNIP